MKIEDHKILDESGQEMIGVFFPVVCEFSKQGREVLRKWAAKHKPDQKGDKP